MVGQEAVKRTAKINGDGWQDKGKYQMIMPQIMPSLGNYFPHKNQQGVDIQVEQHPQDRA